MKIMPRLARVKDHSSTSQTHQEERIFGGENSGDNPSAGKGEVFVNNKGDGDTIVPAQGGKGGKSDMPTVAMSSGGLSRKKHREELQSSQTDDEDSREDKALVLAEMNNSTFSIFWRTATDEEQHEWEGEHVIVKSNQALPGGEKRTTSARIGNVWSKLPFSKLKIVVGEFSVILLVTSSCAYDCVGILPVKFGCSCCFVHENPALTVIYFLY